MRNGYRVVDIDTHVNPSFETLVRYLDPSARSRVDEFRPFVRTRSSDGITTRVLHVAPYPFDRFPGETPHEAMVVAGGKGALRAASLARRAIIACRPRPASRTRISLAGSRTWIPKAATSISLFSAS
jgi:hypothetical protein